MFYMHHHILTSWQESVDLRIQPLLTVYHSQAMFDLRSYDLLLEHNQQAQYQ